ncbi:MAG: DUF4338 domain-containing protein, partial [Deltaproteobacteria bacterium]
MEEKGLVKLPARLRHKNNLKPRCFAQTPIFKKEPRNGHISGNCNPEIRLIESGGDYLWSFLLHHYHYLNEPKLVGEHLRYLVYL